LGDRRSACRFEEFDSLTTIPASRLALAVSAYEMNNPGNELRELLTRKPAVSKGVMAQDDQEKRIKKWLDVMELPSGLEEDQDEEREERDDLEKSEYSGCPPEELMVSPVFANLIVKSISISLENAQFLQGELQQRALNQLNRLFRLYPGHKEAWTQK
jgi:hypothetical protein